MLTDKYQISVNEQVLLVKNRGTWTTMTEISYISDLALEFDRLRSQPFWVLIDMRQWHGLCEQDNGLTRPDVSLDRRSQRGEIWLTRDREQGRDLVKFLHRAGVPLTRTTQVTEVCSVLRTQRVRCNENVLQRWLALPQAERLN